MHEGLYPEGHHDKFCPVEGHSPAPPVHNEAVVVIAPDESEEV